jgi:actin-related protein
MCRGVCIAQVNVHVPEKPSLLAWRGASMLGSSPAYSELSVTRAQYDEYGCENLVGMANGGIKSGRHA